RRHPLRRAPRPAGALLDRAALVAQRDALRADHRRCGRRSRAPGDGDEHRRRTARARPVPVHGRRSVRVARRRQRELRRRRPAARAPGGRHDGPRRLRRALAAPARRGGGGALRRDAREPHRRDADRALGRDDRRARRRHRDDLLARAPRAGAVLPARPEPAPRGRAHPRARGRAAARRRPRRARGRAPPAARSPPRAGGPPMSPIDPSLTRRRFLELAIAGAAAAAAGCDLGAPTLSEWPFTLGVASGDPLPDRVVLWTRLAPDPVAPDGRGGMPPEPFPVYWEVARDEAFRAVVRTGVAVADPGLAHSVHVDVNGL